MVSGWLEPFAAVGSATVLARLPFRRRSSTNTGVAADDRAALPSPTRTIRKVSAEQAPVASQTCEPLGAADGAR